MANERNQKAERPKLSKEEWAEMKALEKESLYTMIDDTADQVTKDEESLKAFLDSQARLDRYSAGNALLIHNQFPEATQLKDFNSWTEAKAQVKKGAKAISIFEPVEYTKADGTPAVTFNVKKVFDVSQTTARKMPAPSVNRDALELVKLILSTCPINYEQAKDLPNNYVAAYYDNDSNTLLVKEGVGDSVSTFQAVAQELSLAEISVNSKEYSRSKAIIPAMCSVYMLCKKYGVDTKNINLSRVAEELGKMEPADIRSNFSQARNALSEVHTRMYEELNKNRAARQQEQSR